MCSRSPLSLIPPETDLWVGRKSLFVSTHRITTADVTRLPGLSITAVETRYGLAPCRDLNPRLHLLSASDRESNPPAR